MKRNPNVALLVETAREYGRQLLLGVAQYARLHGPWSFQMTPGDFEQATADFSAQQVDGIITRLVNKRIHRLVVEANVPTIVLGLRDWQVANELPLDCCAEHAGDSEQAAKLAAEHLLERHFRHYGFVGMGDRAWSTAREQGFRAAISEAGFETLVYPIPARKSDRVWDRERQRLADWIKQLPKPIGIMACNDDRGREVLDACRLAGVMTPEEVAVVGVDNDDLYCDLSVPPLSSVAWNGVTGGYETAALLDKMMRGETRGQKNLAIVVQPLHVVTRRSTDVIALDNRDVAESLAFIRANHAHGVNVDEVAAHVSLSRRNLEIAFRKEVGRTIHGEIQRVRFDHARRLLEETDYSVPKVAELAGYGAASYLIQVFRQRLGLTPQRYRATIRV
ncbi:Xylose operon regulatory protein [Pirellulimonas nuda]|uniref:Xylose operon regulatory protein n=1 Tax=Pirellulimonas nuda TaxID=2528009 RepID=A0A518DHT3_9BACT|nr:DNA-binding transcriptional regulator [Pirellulimonas nuda]QDU91033.1 Xylose operon regulatory protein [Pirellulimonas nuda]